MRKLFALGVSATVLLQISAHLPAQDAPATNAAVAEKGNDLAALEQMLFGTWYGPDCGGDYTFHADGTFHVRRFSPGNNNLTGSWAIRWDALPPTLLLTYKTSDVKTRSPDWPEYEYLGKTREPKILELNGEILVYQFPGDDIRVATLTQEGRRRNLSASELRMGCRLRWTEKAKAETPPPSCGNPKEDASYESLAGTKINRL